MNSKVWPFFPLVIGEVRPCQRLDEEDEVYTSEGGNLGILGRFFKLNFWHSNSQEKQLR